MSDKNSYTYSIPVTVSDRLWYLICAPEMGYSVLVIFLGCFRWFSGGF